MELKVFHKFIPSKRSHKLPALVYVVADRHMYPVLDEGLRRSVFSSDRANNVVKRTTSKRPVFDNSKPVVVNPAFTLKGEYFVQISGREG